MYINGHCDFCVYKAPFVVSDDLKSCINNPCYRRSAVYYEEKSFDDAHNDITIPTVDEFLWTHSVLTNEFLCTEVGGSKQD